MNRLVLLLSISLLWVGLICPPRTNAQSNSADSGVQVTSILGETSSVEKVEINSPGTVRLDGADETFSLDEFQAFEFSAKESRRGKWQVGLRSGARVFTSQISLKDELCIFEIAGQQATVPLENLQFIRFANDEVSEIFQAGLESPLAEQDQVYLKVENSIQALPSVAESFADGSLKLIDGDNESYQVPVAQLYGIVFANFGEEPPRRGPHTITLSDGSVLVGTIGRLAEAELSIMVGSDLELRSPESVISAIRIRSGRLVFLSDLEPSEIVMRPIVTEVKRWERDRSVAGNGLSLQMGDKSTKEFKKGLGVHSYSQLTFPNEGYDQFAAWIGIDAETGGRGNCEFVVLGDGKELFRKQMSGDEPAVEVQLDVEEFNVVTLRVEAGEALDLADHANWCDARLFRTKTN